eukprot:TRINITY_DN38056_c0_g1_i1.p1 TRINITY_DN38056_c0_g1~~TRINITY_DN38056_c0_g1_i1.p1  ORF type:complete len:307 (+),score=23.50 TRINITY_DN38056_c0_g1_i1:119-922(+)
MCIRDSQQYYQQFKKQNEEFVQKIIENHPAYFNHLKGNCACGKCICGKCRCDIAHFEKIVTQPPKSIYQTQFKSNIPYENNKLDHKISQPPGINMNKKPIDEQYQSISKSSFTEPSSSHIEIFKAPHPKLQNQELSGCTTYRYNFKKQPTQLTPMLSPIGYTKVLTSIPFEGQSLYTKEYNKNYNLVQDPAIFKIISKCRYPMFYLKIANEPFEISFSWGYYQSRSILINKIQVFITSTYKKSAGNSIPQISMEIYSQNRFYKQKVN